MAKFILLSLLITNDGGFSIIEIINHQFIFKDTMQIDKFRACVNEWNFDKILKLRKYCNNLSMQNGRDQVNIYILYHLQMR